MEYAQTNHPDNTLSNSGLKTGINLAALFTIMAGGLFKSMWWAGADILILISTVFLLVTIALAYKDLLRSGNDSTTSLLLTGMLGLLTISALFRRMHWEGAMVLVMAAVALTLVLGVYLIFRRDNLRLPKQFAIGFILYVLYLYGAIQGIINKVAEAAAAN